MTVTLSICIPTFNREGDLRRTLADLRGEVVDLEGKVEIIVADNKPADNTRAVVRDCKVPHLRYVANSENVGFDRNCDIAVREARGRFVWLMSDDDFLQAGAVRRVCELLEEHGDVVFSFVNYSVSQADGEEPSACSDTEIVRLSSQDLLLRTRFAFSFVGSCIFRRDSWLRMNPLPYFGSGWIHLFMARDVLLHGSALLIGQRLVRMQGLDLVASRREKARESQEMEFYIKVHLEFLKFAFSLGEAGYAPRVANEARRFAWMGNLRQIVYYKATRQRFMAGELIRIVGGMRPYFGRKLAFWLFHVPLLFVPNWIVSATFFGLRPLYRRVKQASFSGARPVARHPATRGTVDG